MHQTCSLRIESTGRFISKEHCRVLCELPGEDDPLLLATGQVTGDVHHPVGQSDLVDEISRTVDGVFLGIIDIVEGVENILDYPIVTVEGKRPLEHDCSPVHYPGLRPVSLLVPEININGHEIAATLGTFFPARLWTSMKEQRSQAAM